MDAINICKDIFDKYIFKNKNEIKEYYLLFLIAILLLGFILPTVVFHSPNGSDVYTHIFNTNKMEETNSLLAYYEASFHDEYLGYDYPFGLWFFGSLVMKITGIDGITLSYLLPLIMMIISIMLFFIYSRYLLNSDEKALLSSIFLISMPLIALNLLNYSTSKFVMIFLITIFFLSIQKVSLKNFLIVILLVFTLCFTHTGTYMFLIFFAISYLLLYALIWKKFDIPMYFLAVSTLFIYVFIVQLFPFVQPQYVNKGTFVISISDSISSALNLEIISEFGILFYESLFVANNYIYAIFWSSFIFLLVKLCLYFHSRMEKFNQRKKMALPFVGNLTNISHGIITSPFWLGPVQTVFAIPGIFKLDSKGKCIALALIFSAFLPGALKSAEKTGALREIYYLYLIVPVAAAAGFYYIMPAISKCIKEKVKNDRIESAIILLLYLLVFVPLIVAPVLGSLHYQPIITGSDTEKENLKWLSGIGDSFEGACSFGYRERVDLYANKITPSIYSGSDMSRYLDDLRYTYFYNGTEEYTKDLYSYNLKYIFVSDRVLKGYNDFDETDLQIDSNKQLDRIYSANDDFGIYSYIESGEMLNKTNLEKEKIDFSDHGSDICKYGSAYLFENDFYKIRLSEYSPEIAYIGTKTKSILGEGYFSDLVGVSWSTSQDKRFGYYYLNELEYSEVLLGNNSLTYKTVITCPDSDELWATFYVKYTFYEKAFKREIFAANDRLVHDTKSDMILRFSNGIFAPMTDFEYIQIEDGSEEVKFKKIYPSQDSVRFSEKKFKQIYFNEGDFGFMIRFEDNLPYPGYLTYGGSTVYDVGHVSVSSKYYIPPSGSVNIVQYFSVGEKNSADINVDKYSSVSVYPFPYGKVPVILCGPAYYNNTKGFSDNDLRSLFGNSIIYNSVVENPEVFGSERSDNAISYFKITENRTFKDKNAISDELGKIKHKTNSNGVIFSSYTYTLDAIDSMSVNDYFYAISDSVSAPFEDSFREGLRIPKLGMSHGEKTGVVLLPVTRPEGSVLRSDYDENNAFESWKRTLDSAFEDDGIAIFMWDKMDLTNPYYVDDFKNLIYYANQKDMHFTTPDEIASHYMCLQNINAEITNGMDYAVLDVYNDNDIEVHGVTYKIVLPFIDSKCLYLAHGGNISRSIVEGDQWKLYVTFDLEPHERRIVSIEPDIARKEFKTDFSHLYEGKSKIIVFDNYGNPVDGAYLTFDSSVYETDENGEVLIESNRGMHNIVLEKPGYDAAEYEIETKGRIYSIFS